MVEAISAISIIGFIVGIALLVFMVIKGFSMILASVSTCIILLATSGLSFWDGLLTTYAGGAGGFYTSWFFLMLLGGIFGHLCTQTGMATKIAKIFTGVLTGNLMIIGVFAVIFLLTMLGVNGYLMCFVMFPILNAMMKERGMDRQVIPMILVSNSIANSFAFSMDPVNVLPSTLLGTGLGAAPVLGIIFTVVHLTLTVLYFNIHQSRVMAKRKREELLAEYDEATKNTSTVADDNLPSFTLSILPFVLCFTCVVVLSRNGYSSAISIVASLTLGNVLIILFMFKDLKEKLKEHLTTGAVSGLTTLITITTMIGLARVIVANPVYAVIVEGVMAFDMPMYLTVFIGTSILTAMTGSALTGPTLFLESFSEKLIANGIDVDALHRVSAVSSMALNKLPNSGVACTVVSVSQTKVSTSFKHILLGAALPAFIAGLVVALCATAGIVM